MGTKLRDEDLKLNIIVNGNSAKKELGDLEKSTRILTAQNKELRAEKQKLIRAGQEESAEYKEVTAQIRENNKAIKANEARMTKLRSEIGLTGLTLKQLRSEQVRLKRLLDSSTYGTAQWKQYRAELTKVEARMAKVRAGGKSMNLSLSKMANGLNKYFNLIAAGAAMVTGIVFSIKEWTKGLVNLDDAMADVMKTTGLTRTEVRDMYTDFKYLNTRTPRAELLALAEEAGRLGINGKKNIEDFVEVANKIKVALGDDLGGESEKAIREVGKLVEVYKVGDEYGTEFKESLNKVGSAINEVSANSNSQAEYQIGFMKRMGGTAQQAGITAADILGYASTLDQLGQTQETAATAMSKTIISMFKDASEYAAIAGISVEDFTNLLDTDANDAFMKVLEGLNGNNEGLTIMAGKLDNLGIDGARATQVLAALASNTKMVNEQQTLANKAMNEGTSLTNEYNIKNNNLAGSMDKIGRAIRSAFINSGFLKWMEDAVAKVAEFTEIKLSDKIQKEKTDLNNLVTSIIAANNNQRVRNNLIKELQSSYPDFLKNMSAEEISNKNLKDRLIEVNAQYREKIKLAALQEKTTKIQATGIALAGEEQEIIESVSKLYSQYRMEGLGFAETFEEQVAAFQKAGEKGFIAKGLALGVKNLGESYQEVQEKIKANADEYQRWSDIANKVQLRLNEGGTNQPEVGDRTLFYGMAYEWDGTTWKLIIPETTTPDKPSPGTGKTSKIDTTPEEEQPQGMESWMTADWDTPNLQTEILKEKMANEKEFTDFLAGELQTRMDGVETNLNHELKAIGMEKEAREQLAYTIMDSGQMMLSTLSSIAGEQSTLGTALYALSQGVAIAGIWVKVAADNAKIYSAALAEFAYLGPGAPAAAAAWAAAPISANNTQAGIQTGLIAAQSITSLAFAEGKYPEAETNSSLYTGTYGDKPQYALFNEVPGQPEMVVDGKTFKTMQMDYPGLVDAIYKVRDGKQPTQYASGKYPEVTVSQPQSSISAQTAKDLTTALNKFAEKELTVGIKTIVEKTDKYYNMKSKMGM